ncbi:DUF6544 family protein [Runella salmonicolor]|uniref:Uncharacterized protein n=1 Tax=Runella salmonicolor TaxID=2950278 RepID=A0ABT1FU82_9BACT|nr:DUF6544 family protein [Runella salmonicolor]MCP1385317.1 hypothetical protein [Runella salmonicolor]
MRYFFAFILLVHGLIHLMGFVKAFKLAEISQLTQVVSKPSGVFWLMAAVLFALTTTLLILQKQTWWMAAAPAVILSQALIFTNWQEAKFGTIANVIILAGVVLGYADWGFNRMVKRELKEFRSTTLPAPQPVLPERVKMLPPVVQKWLHRSKVVGKEEVQVVNLKQKGEMKTKPDGNWIPFEAEQYNSVIQPGFIWQTRIQMMPLVTILGRDKYENGRGNMLIKVLGLFALADSKGPSTDQGTLLRNLGEICWFPSAALRDYIQWEQLDSLSAKATMTYGQVTASGVFRFNPDGDLVSFEAKRYYDRKEGATLEDWLVTITGYKEFYGVRIGYQSEVTWKLKTGDYTWLKLEVTDIRYNNPRN